MVAQGKVRVLLVDDDLAFADLMRLQLSLEGFDVAAFTSCSSAIEAFSRQPCDVLVTDLLLAPSDGSGLDLIHSLRKQDPTLPVVVLTGFPSQSRRDLLEANVPVVEKGERAIEVLTKAIHDAVRSTGHTGAATTSMARPGPALIDQLRGVFAEEAERLLKIKESSLVVPGEEPIALPKAIHGYKRDIEKRLIKFPYHQNVFLMMKFRDTNREVGSFICDTLQSHGLRGIRADLPEWNITKNVFNPIAVLHCCKYGIALFDRAEARSRQVFSANVAYELGMMHQQNKTCLVLKHASLPPIPFDLIKDLYQTYEEDLRLKGHIGNWIHEISFEANELTARLGV